MKGIIRALRAELLRLFSTRLWLGGLALAGGLTVLITVIESVRSGSGGGVVPSLATAAGQRSIVTATGLAILLAAVFGTTVSTGDFRYRTATDTYLDDPNRVRVLVAKLMASAVVGAMFGVVAAGVATAMGLGFVAARGDQLALTGSSIARYAGGTVVAASLLSAAGAGLGALIRSQLAAVIAVFAWGFAVEQLVAVLSKSAAPYLPVVAANTMAGATGVATMPPIPSGLTALPFAGAAGLLAGVALAISLAAACTTVRRDVA